jgi:signal transduction histidine kinase
VEVQSIAQILSSQNRLRDRAVSGARQALVQSRSGIQDVLAAGGAMDQRSALVKALLMTGSVEAELFDSAGRLLLAVPQPGTARNPLTSADVEGLRGGTVLIVGPVIGPPSRILSYGDFFSGGSPVILRLSTPVPDLVADLRDRERNLAGHGVALLTLVLAAALLLAPSRPERESVAPRALDAYAEAMGRLGERDRVRSAEHVAERERLEKAFHEHEAMARAGELSSGIVHEVRNGLGTILGYARLLERRVDDTGALEEIRGIRGECETLEVVIRRFTDFIKTESLNIAPFDLRGMLSRVVARESKNRPGGAVLLSSGEMGVVRADEELLERAFENLVRNARDAAGPDGNVSIGVERGDSSVRVSISDDGPGFGAAERERLRPFFTTKPNGLGLGLPMARKIVVLHGGSLVFEDRVPRGLTVRVFLPEERLAGPT